MRTGDKIYIAGHKGMVGAAITRALRKKGYVNLLGKTSAQLDLRDQYAVDKFFRKEKPDYVFLAAARTGSAPGNGTSSPDFLYDNLMIEANVIHAAWKYGVRKLLFIGSSCIYPKYAPQPIKERYLLTGTLEPDNESNAIAKIAGIKLCASFREQHGVNFISAVPANVYGPGDHFEGTQAHVIPSLIRKFHEAKINGLEHVSVLGSGKPRREFLFVDDLADACLLLMHYYNEKEIINVGTGKDLPIKDLVLHIKEVVGYHGNISYDLSRPDGAPRKWLDVSRLHALGWNHKTSLGEGLKLAYRDFQLRNNKKAGSLILQAS